MLNSLGRFEATTGLYLEASGVVAGVCEPVRGVTEMF